MAKFIKIYPENPNEREIQKVVDCLREGGVIIYPTDTVYGLGCDITHSKALERIAQLKGIKLDKANFSFICADLSNLSEPCRELIPLSYQGATTYPRSSRRKKQWGSVFLTIPLHVLW